MPALFPYVHFVMHVHLTMREARSVLLKETIIRGKSNTSHKDDYLRRFSGKISDDWFVIIPVIGSGRRNSFRPFIVGRFAQKNHEVQVQVWMTLHPLVIVFLVFWSGFLASISFVGGILNTAFTTAMIALFYIICTAVFNDSASDAAELIKSMYRSEPDSY